MWISSLVVTLTTDPEESEQTIRSLEDISVLTVGQHLNGKIPVVIEAADGQASRYWYEWLENLPAIQHVELAFVSFDEGQDAAGPASLEEEIHAV